jgi:hypothetical protein
MPSSEEMKTFKWLVLTNDAPRESNRIPFNECEEAALALLDDCGTRNGTIFAMKREAPTDLIVSRPLMSSMTH